MKDKSLSLNRALVLRIIKDKEPIAIHEIQKETKLPRSTIIHHIEQLKSRKLILKKTAEEIKGQKELGSPVYLTTNQANPTLKGVLQLSGSLVHFLKENQNEK